jgi:PAS domain S-box-containing protein
VSPQAERILGISTDEIVGRSIFEFLHPEEEARAHEEYARTLRESGEAVPSVLRFRDSAGEWIPFEIIANNQIHEPEIGAVIFTARDLRYRRELEDSIRRANTELDSRVEARTMDLARANAALRLENQQRRFTEKQLSESLSLLNATLESTADGILVVSTEGTIRSFNQKFVDMWRIPQSALATLSDDTLLRCASPQLEQPEEFLNSTRNLYASPDETSLDTLRLKDGRIFERYSQPQRVSSKTTGRVWSFRDVTQERRLEEELRQAQKMEAIGRLAGGVAHDFNNVLMLISGYASQLLDDPQLSKNGKGVCRQLVAATSRAVAVTRQLLAFSRKNPIAPRVLDLNEVVSDLAKMLPRLLSDLVQLQLEVQQNPLPIFADRSQMELIIVNLALNARDAMPNGGTLSVTTRRETLDQEKGTSGGSPRAFAILQVSDTGEGMSADISSRIFEPFFTTKGVGKGTGLGLSTAYGIVEQAGGHITVESEPEKGSTFRVYLPMAEGTPKEEIIEAPVEFVRGDETILLVEDEEGIRVMTRTYLAGLGYKVLEAANGPDALGISREYGSQIDLLLTDVLMPGMRGDDLAHLLQKERPGILTLFISGYANAYELGSTATVIEKPFAFPELGKKLREALDKDNYLHQRQAS